jgi:predicted ATPase
VARQVSLAGGPQAATELLERERELAALEECLEAVGRGSGGRVVLVSGEAGAGKTALVRRFAEERDRSVRVLWGGCDPLFTPSPLGPLLSIAEDAGGELAEVLARGVPPHEVAAALAHDLQARASTLLVLEDLHWADEATLDVCMLLARRIEAVPAVIVASYRDDELPRPLRIVVGELATSQAVSRLRLAPLSPAAVAELAEPHGVDADELYRKTAGNPFFVVEALATQGDEVPDTVRDAVFARTARISGAAKQLLESVSIVQGPVELWLLEAFAREAIDGLDE